MPIKGLNDEQIDLLIEILPVVYHGTENTIVPTLRKIRDCDDLNSDDRKHIDDWNKAPAESGGYKGALALTYIIIKYFKERGVEI